MIKPLTDFRALCAELVDDVEVLLVLRPPNAQTLWTTEERLTRARAALAEPVIPVKQRVFPTPSQAAECGGPCYEGNYCPEACDCGLYQPLLLPAANELETHQ